MIQNPILRGCNPNPSILRVADDYYIANLTFEWFPGIQIHHSKDSLNKVSLIAKRVQSSHSQADTCVESKPKHFQQMAGLVCLYDNVNHYYLRVYHSDSLKGQVRRADEHRQR